MKGEVVFTLALLGLVLWSSASPGVSPPVPLDTEGARAKQGLVEGPITAFQGQAKFESQTLFAAGSATRRAHQGQRSRLMLQQTEAPNSCNLANDDCGLWALYFAKAPELATDASMQS